MSEVPLNQSVVLASTELSETSPDDQQPISPPLVMQIIVRKDLLEKEGWGVGPLMAQVAHATSAVLHESRELPDTRRYLDDLKNMRKVILQTSDASSLQRLSDLLSAASPPAPHHLWIEQPENIPTCLALAPNTRDSRIKKALDKAGCRLWKN